MRTRTIMRREEKRRKEKKRGENNNEFINYNLLLLSAKKFTPKINASEKKMKRLNEI